MSCYRGALVSRAHVGTVRSPLDTLPTTPTAPGFT
jgi:hypothetical protein